MPELRKGPDSYLSTKESIDLEEKRILKELESRYQNYLSEKPTRAGYDRYTRDSRRLIFRLHRLSEQRRVEERSNLPTDVYLHVHTSECTRDETGACGEYQRKDTAL